MGPWTLTLTPETAAWRPYLNQPWLPSAARWFWIFQICARAAAPVWFWFTRLLRLLFLVPFATFQTSQLLCVFFLHFQRFFLVFFFLFFGLIWLINSHLLTLTGVFQSPVLWVTAHLKLPVIKRAPKPELAQTLGNEISPKTHEITMSHFSQCFPF